MNNNVQYDRPTNFLELEVNVPKTIGILRDVHSKKRKTKPEMGDFHVSALLFLRVQIFFVRLFALHYQISWLICLTKFGYMMSQE